jgi:hypothetical protein
MFIFRRYFSWWTWDGFVFVAHHATENFSLPAVWAANTFPEKYRTHANITRAAAAFFLSGCGGMKRTLFPTLRLNAEWKDGCGDFARQRSLARSQWYRGKAARRRTSLSLSLFALTLHASKYIT